MLLLPALLTLSQPTLAGGLFGNSVLDGGATHKAHGIRIARQLADIDIPHTAFATRDGQKLIRHLLTAGTGKVTIQEVDYQQNAEKVSRTFDLSIPEERVRAHAMLERIAARPMGTDTFSISARNIVAPHILEKQIAGRPRMKIGSRLAWAGVAGVITWVIWDRMTPKSESASSPSIRTGAR